MPESFSSTHASGGGGAGCGDGSGTLVGPANLMTTFSKDCCLGGVERRGLWRRPLAGGVGASAVASSGDESANGKGSGAVAGASSGLGRGLAALEGRWMPGEAVRADASRPAAGVLCFLKKLFN